MQAGSLLIGIDGPALESLVRELTDWGEDAIECHYPKYTPEQEAFYLHLAEKYGLHVKIECSRGTGS